MSKEPPEKRFWRHIQKADTGCWLWTASGLPGGYGRFGVDGRLWLAHRWSYEHFVGKIPEGLEIDHLCKQRRCCNPSHLEPVTHTVNVRRGDVASVNRARLIAITHCPKGHTYDAVNTHVRANGKRQCRACNRESAKRRYHKNKENTCG